MPLLHSKKATILLISTLLLITIAVSGTIAYFTSSPPPLENTVDPAVISIEVVEDNRTDGAQSNVKILNTSNVKVFIRAYVVYNFVSESNSTHILGISPIENQDFVTDYASSGWIKGSDGFWYYETAVDPGELTLALIESCDPILSAPDGYKLNVRVVAGAIQANPSAAVEDAFGVTYSNGKIIPK